MPEVYADSFRDRLCGAHGLDYKFEAASEDGFVELLNVIGRYAPYQQSTTCQKRPIDRPVKQQKRPIGTDIPPPRMRLMYSARSGPARKCHSFHLFPVLGFMRLSMNSSGMS
jgi:hypothetical protein